MKGSRLTTFIALAGTTALAAIVLPAKAQAEGPHLIAMSGNFVTVVRQSFANSNCDPAIADSPINGLDARILNGAPYAGTPRNVSWGPVAAPSPLGRLTVFFYSGSCGQLLDPTTDGTILGPSKTVFVPHGTRWIVVENFFNGPVNFHIN